MGILKRDRVGKPYDVRTESRDSVAGDRSTEGADQRRRLESQVPAFAQNFKTEWAIGSNDCCWKRKMLFSLKADFGAE